MKAYIAAGFAALFATMAAQLEAEHKDELVMPATTLALAIQSLAMGLIYQAILSPGAVTREAMLEAYAALARGAIR